MNYANANSLAQRARLYHPGNLTERYDVAKTMGDASNLICSRCNKQFQANQAVNLCHCGGPLLVSYDLPKIRSQWKKSDLKGSINSMWRYAPVLPCELDAAVTLQEGWTPLVRATRLQQRLSAANLWVKDEGLNPTGSFKARGLSCAVSMAKKMNLQKLAIPSAGNAGSALAAYAAAGEVEAHIFMPRDVPQSNFVECKSFGANVTLVDGLIGDCGRLVAEGKQREGWFEVTTLKEPYRIEGKKTMGYELAEQLDWRVPDAILYPCGGGVGLIGIWKAFTELEELGWITSKRPKMIAVQAAGCQPITRAFKQNMRESEPWPQPHTVASGLRVPKPLGDFLVLKAVNDSSGTVISISDEDMIDAGLLLAELEGIFAAPEGGACVSAVWHLMKAGFLRPEDQIVILNTGSGLKYLEAYATRFPRRVASEQDKLGGLITPR